MKKHLMLLALLAASVSAFAGNDNCNGRDSCSTGTSGSSTSTSSSDSSSTGFGLGIGLGIGTGGNSTGISGGSFGGSATGISGGSFGGTSISSNKNNNASSAVVTTGAVNVQVNTAPSAEQTRDASDATVQAAKLQADAIRYASEQKIYNTPSVNGPALTSSNDTCMGSSSGSVNIPGLGIGGGTTWVDNNCRMLKNSRELWNMGMKAAAMALMCTDSGNKEALELTGFKCPQSKRDEESRAAMDKASLYNGTDPIVRARLGMSVVDGSGKAVVSGDGKAVKSN